MGTIIRRVTYNWEWWFLISYVFALFSFPIIRAISNRCTLKTNVLLVLIGSILVTNVLPAIGNIEVIGNLKSNYIYANFFCQSAPYISCFWMGAVVAKEGVLERLKESMVKCRLLNPISDILLLAIIVFLRQTGMGDKLDIFYIPFLIIASLDLVYRCKFVKKLLLTIGKQSTNMWLIHTFCCYYFYAIVKVVVAPRWAVASLLLLVIISYALSIATSFIWKIIEKVLYKVGNYYSREN